MVGHNGKVALARGITPTVFRFIATEFTIKPINKSTRPFQNSNTVKEFHDFQSIAISRPVSSLGNLSNFPSRILICAKCYWGLCPFTVVSLFLGEDAAYLGNSWNNTQREDEDYCLQLNKIRFVRSRRLREVEAGGLCDTVMDGRQLERGHHAYYQRATKLIRGCSNIISTHYLSLLWVSVEWHKRHCLCICLCVCLSNCHICHCMVRCESDCGVTLKTFQAVTWSAPPIKSGPRKPTNPRHEKHPPGHQRPPASTLHGRREKI